MARQTLKEVFMNGANGVNPIVPQQLPISAAPEGAVPVLSTTPPPRSEALSQLSSQVRLLSKDRRVVELLAGFLIGAGVAALAVLAASNPVGWAVVIASLLVILGLALATDHLKMLNESLADSDQRSKEMMKALLRMLGGGVVGAAAGGASALAVAGATMASIGLPLAIDSLGTAAGNALLVPFAG
jgi:hypothetical protein